MIALSVLMLAGSFSSCKKDKQYARYLFNGTWVAKDPVKYSYNSGGQNLGVGATEFQQEVLEMKFEGKEDGLGGYWGSEGSGSISLNTYDANGTAVPATIDYGFWSCKLDGNKTPVQLNAQNMPQELKDMGTVLGELWSKNGATRFYILSLTKNKMKVVFLHMNSFSSGTNYYYYSPVMTFNKKK